VSVDGFLARPDDALDFLHTGEQEPHGFKEFLASVDVVVIGRRTFDVVLKLGHLVLYGKKPVIVLSSRPLDFSSVKGGVVEKMSGRTDRNRKAAQIPRLPTRLYRRWHHDSAIPRGRMHRPIGDYARAGSDRSRHPVVWSSAARHLSSPRRDAQL
jgi:hypothetical protein